MTDATTGALAPKKRSLFKRAAWQDAAKKEGGDIFSHSNEFNDIVAEEKRRKEEEKRKHEEAKRKAEEEQKRELAEKQEKKKGKRRKVSSDCDEPVLTRGSSGDSKRTNILENKGRSRTPLSPIASTLPPNSLAARYDNLTKSTLSQDLGAQPVIVDLGDSDQDDDNSSYKTKSFGDTWDDTSYGAELKHDMTIHSSRSTLFGDSLEEIQDPEIAAIEARARARAAAKKAAAASGSKAPIAQLFIESDLPDTTPLMVKVRIDSTIEKPREAWCARQRFTPEMTRNVFFTWRGTRLYDSTTIKRLGIKVDDYGNVTIEGDSNIYDESNLPKVHVRAWTDETLAQRKRELAAEAEAARRAVEPSPSIGEREPTPELTPIAKKYRFYLKAKGMEDVKIQAKPDTTFEKLADAFRTTRNIPKTQPVTLMFDGERLSPMDTVQDTELEDMDSIDVLLK